MTNYWLIEAEIHRPMDGYECGLMNYVTQN